MREKEELPVTHLRPVIISVLNAKGGVGKTTTTMNVGAALAQVGARVLLIDLDLQANLTHSLIGDLPTGISSIAEAMTQETGLDEIIRPTTTPGLDLAPAGETLIGLDITLAGAMGREQILKTCLKYTQCMPRYDADFIDNPPYISLATVNSLVASTHFLIPVSCEYLPMVGIKLLNENIEKVRHKLNPDLALLGVVLTMYDKREGITRDVEALIREQLGNEVFDTVIRINTKYKSTPIERQTIFQYEHDADGRGSEDYRSLTREIAARLEQTGWMDAPRLEGSAT
jgi:chromosome partitioning protein